MLDDEGYLLPLTLLAFTAVHCLIQQGTALGKPRTERDEPWNVQGNTAGAAGKPAEEPASMALDSG